MRHKTINTKKIINFETKVQCTKKDKKGTNEDVVMPFWWVPIIVPNMTVITQLIFICSKSTIETLETDVKNVEC